MSATNHPSKEQVRAYMHQREGAHRPPPRPDEIRRQLGWHVASGAGAPVVADVLFLPSMIAQLATLLMLQWYFLAADPYQSN